MSIRLSRAEAWAELGTAHTGVLTTLRSDGMPISLPVWFVALDEKIYVSGPAHTKKFGRLRSDNRCSFLVESGQRWVELRAVHLTGTASPVADPQLLEQIQTIFDAKYERFSTPLSEMPDGTRQHYSIETTTIEITPDDRILSWDNARIDVGS